MDIIFNLECCDSIKTIFINKSCLFIFTKALMKSVCGSISGDTESSLEHNNSKQQNNLVHVTTLHVINVRDAPRPQVHRDTAGRSKESKQV